MITVYILQSYPTITFSLLFALFHSIHLFLPLSSLFSRFPSTFSFYLFYPIRFFFFFFFGFFLSFLLSFSLFIPFYLFFVSASIRRGIRSTSSPSVQNEGRQEEEDEQEQMDVDDGEERETSPHESAPNIGEGEENFDFRGQFKTLQKMQKIWTKYFPPTSSSFNVTQQPSIPRRQFTRLVVVVVFSAVPRPVSSPRQEASLPAPRRRRRHRVSESTRP